MSLIHEDKTGLLKGMFFEVQNEVGLGRREEAYHQACRLWLEERRIPHVSKPPHRLMLGDQEAYVLYPDFVVWDCITVELKAVPRKLSQGEFVQLFDYLKCREDRLGLLVNFGLDRVQCERVVCDPSATEFNEDWSYWSGAIHDPEREVGIAVRDALRLLYETHGTGYGDEVFERLAVSALVRQGLDLTLRPASKAYYHEVEVDESPLDCIIVENRLLLTFSALFDNVNFSVNRGLSYMRSLDLK